MQAVSDIELRPSTEAGKPNGPSKDSAHGIRGLGVAEKIYCIVGLFVLLTALLLAMSIQSVRLQATYRHELAASSTAALNIERVNRLIYSIVMESRGIYMSTEPSKVKQFSDELLKRNRDLAHVVAEWELTVHPDDAAQFAAFKKQIAQFIDFRVELVRRAIEIGPAAGREWGDNDANRVVRAKLNADLEAIAQAYAERARQVTELGERTRYASWYLTALGIGALLLAAFNVLVMRRSVLTPLAEITKATDRIAAGKVSISIPYLFRRDEIGRLAHAMQSFLDAASRNIEYAQRESELVQRELDVVKERGEAAEEHEKLNDKYYATKWQLSAAINNMPQGLMMLDAAANILVMNDQYRTMYALPPEIKVGSSLRDILDYRFKKGFLKKDVTEYLAVIMARIAKRQPSTDEIPMTDGRVISVQERPMDGGGWVATHNDITEYRRSQRILERTERFLATIIENIPEGIVAKDARSMRYVFVNSAAEKMIGLSRAEIMGKTARELFPEATAELIEKRDRQLISQKQQLEAIIDTVENPFKGRRTIAVRRLQVGGPDGESQLFVSMIEDLTEQGRVAA